MTPATLDLALDPRQDFAPSERLLLVALGRVADLQGAGRVSMADLGARIGLGRKATAEAFARLEGRGLVKRGGHRGPNPPAYRLTIPEATS